MFERCTSALALILRHDIGLDSDRFDNRRDERGARLMRSRPHGSCWNFQRQCSSERGAWNERAKRSRIGCSSPGA